MSAWCKKGGEESVKAESESPRAKKATLLKNEVVSDFTLGTGTVQEPQETGNAPDPPQNESGTAQIGQDEPEVQTDPKVESATPLDFRFVTDHSSSGILEFSNGNGALRRQTHGNSLRILNPHC